MNLLTPSRELSPEATGWVRFDQVGEGGKVTLAFRSQETAEEKLVPG